MQLPFWLKPRWFVPALALLGGGIYSALPSPPALCLSLQRFGAVETGGRCVVKGDVKLEGAVKRLPDHLTVQGNLRLNGTQIVELPVALIVEGDLFLYKTGIGKLPADLTIGGNFDPYGGFGSPGIRCDDIPPSVVIKGQRNCNT